MKIIGLKRIVHEDANMPARDRIVCPNNEDLQLDDGEVASVDYDHFRARWVVTSVTRKTEVKS